MPPSPGNKDPSTAGQGWPAAVPEPVVMQPAHLR
jgi:hypothetical protein